MSSYIVIDGGTTTTRVALISNKKLIDKIKISAGARANMQAPGTLEAAVARRLTDFSRKTALPPFRTRRPI